ncbi:hypothetical protein A1O3_01724 [Capronia epimyces CBS 606.96]|uniref:DUF3669 domain-containing protein n=1 Tax=Capronia epimyces CBS 606.96 TaxID=1182542 RepID=W9YJT5_9EURO|nr:uncharacterized protein A1O3_01724 [Capronia epimyces CBS 606.96]EXJ93167.1 hypothetical protein A1O3_01724 [Capronia epimyces CBS 606.96]
MPRVKDVSEESTSTRSMPRSLLLDELLEQSTRQILRQTLSVGTLLSTTSSFAERMNAARVEDTDPYHLRDIGRGSCGSVFEIPGTAYAIKKGANTRAIWNDFNLTNLAHNSYLTSLGLFEYTFRGRLVPRVSMTRYFNGPDSDEFWAANMKRFPEEDRTRAATFHLDHILAVPEVTRRALIRQFFQGDKQTQHDALANPENQDCLVRVYFGKNNPKTQPYDRTDTLRNFPLYLDEAKMIGLEIDAYAEEMAIGLALLHWKAGIHAQDTEFVIGSSKTMTFGVPKSRICPATSIDNR